MGFVTQPDEKDEKKQGLVTESLHAAPCRTFRPAQQIRYLFTRWQIDELCISEVKFMTSNFIIIFYFFALDVALMQFGLKCNQATATSSEMSISVRALAATTDLIGCVLFSFIVFVL